MMRMFSVRRNPSAVMRKDLSLTSRPLLQAPLLKSTVNPQNTLKNNELKERKFTETLPDSRFFSKLKLAEQDQFSHRKRKRFNYQKNFSAALSLPYSRKELDVHRDEEDTLLSMVKKYVIEHANRRVDLFFYTLIAYYNTEIVPTNGYTDLQHGRGRNTNRGRTITEACHSSLIPSLLDSTIYQNKGRLKHKSLLSGTHFMDSLNATVELPPFVNDFDDILEKTCRKKCLKILHEVSLGRINPMEGLTLFLKMMQDILIKFKEEAASENQSVLLQNSLIRKQFISPNLVDLVINGTLLTTFSDSTQSASDDYIQLLLRMTSEEKALCEKDEKGKIKLYLAKIMEIQNEILTSKNGEFVPGL
ncbi:Dot/Icm T4SS effector RavQ [Legionella pneumophila serogroup 1]|uniref:Dot/Icm T4SS effector RavQ n=1 Tax=Legionella pneumophila TaxID=446 RepID=UPI000482376A|nr:Dot/Icm T4SS effector RavQ [Legionella pneumophila]AMV13927.1 hypothetical protein ULM_12440 [Legionella pneumophila]ANN92201.1 hypothetical protein A9P85_06005 [Legionella pneumophila]MCH9061115.1 Dot/Icm T4SS effector RavQ [Legionella pneumophila serogroup 1]MCH9062367.1 Dot/Icm T4SS effector RavQ [Legionella pneumophila serogroup 1]MCH9067017.1 Dot/Icm T4SS effector RavQ [Legionella pneumophila serogroup 1]